MLFLFSTALLFASAFIPTATNALMSCSNTVNGKFYNLTSLHALGDIKIPTNAGSYDYYVNVCGAVQGPCANHTSAFACQVRKTPPDQFESVLAYSDKLPEPIWGPSAGETGGVKLMFTNGDYCNLRQRVLNVDFQCDENGTGIITIDESPQCTFNIIYPTKVVCPAPTTAAPTTAAPTTEAPTTAAPTTHAPNTTAAPTTEAPTHSPNTTAIPTTEAPTHAPNTTAVPTEAPTSTPTSAASSSTYDDSSITRAGVGVGIGVGVGCMAVVWLLWCCYERSRVQQQRPSASNYGSV